MLRAIGRKLGWISRGGSRSLRANLILIVALAVVPLLAFAVAMVIVSARNEREVFERGAVERTRALITAVDAELKSSIRTLEALATARSLYEGDLHSFYAEAARVRKSQPGWETVIVSHPSGESVLNLLEPLGASLKPVFESRSFDQVTKTLRPAVGDIRFGPLTKSHGFVIRVPVIRDANLKFVLSAVINPVTIDDLLSPQRMPANWVGVVLDRQRRFVSRTIEPQRNVGRLASESLRAALDRSGEGWFRGTTLEGWDVYAPYSRSEFSGWTVALGIPADAIDAGFRRSLLYLALFGGGLLALGLLSAWVLGARTAASIASLSLMAGDVMSGRRSLADAAGLSADRRIEGITEVEAVREAFAAAHQMLKSHSDERERIGLRLQLALDAANIGVHEWLPQTDELIWDDRVRAHWGLAPGARVTFEIFRKAIHPDDKDRLETALKRALDPAEGHYSAEFRVIGVEDAVERWIEARGLVTFENGAPVRLTGTTVDVSARKAFQTRLEGLVQERTARLEETIGELEAFSYSVSHDMRAPLRAMEGYSKALLEDYGKALDPQAKIYLDKIERSAHRLDSLIKDVLAYSRVAKEEIVLMPVDLTALVGDIVSMNPDFQPPHARVIVQKPLDAVLGHEAYLTQCISNLLSNAMKFTAPGVVPEVRVRSERLDGKVRVWFEDNGIGIDPAHHERIFQIFGQVYPQGQYAGTGIGLAICRKATQRMNGEIGVESEIGTGSRFWLLLQGAPQERPAGAA